MRLSLYILCTALGYVRSSLALATPCAWFDGAAANSTDRILYDLFVEYNLPRGAFGATVVALLYSWPNQLYRSGNGTFPTNQMKVNSGSVGDGTAMEAAPNENVVYSHVSYDLASENLILSFGPYEPDRFYSFVFYDPYQDVFASVGVVNANPAGSYLIRPALLSQAYGITKDECPEQYQGCIISPTYAGRILGRVEFFNTSDVAYAEGYLHNASLTRIARSTPQVAPLTPESFQNLSANEYLHVLQAQAVLGGRNPPLDLDLAASLPGLLECAGIDYSTQQYTTPAGVNFTQAVNNFLQIRNSYPLLPGSVQYLSNLWVTLNPSRVASNANGTQIVQRAQTQILGALPNVVEQAIYADPVDQDFQLQNDEALLLTFVSGKPPLSDFGYWDLQVYHASGEQVQGVVANPYNIFSVGSNGNLTYPDGTRVYPSDSTKPADTPFYVLYQSLNNPPPKNWTGNWLPCPANSSAFRVPMRLYAPDVQKILGGSWEFPQQSIIPAIVHH